METRTLGDGGSPRGQPIHQAPHQGKAPLPVPLDGVMGMAPGVAGPTSLDLQKKVGIERALLSAGWPELADKIRDCGLTAKKMRCGSCGGEWLAPDRCHHRLCPDCGHIRALRLFNAHIHLTGRPNLKHLVLTFKNTPELAPEAIPWMRSCFTRLRHRKVFARSWRGGIYSMEFTYTKAMGWHPHIHALIDGDFVPQAEISKAWLAITGSSAVVWIEKAKKSKQVLKYILKPSDELLADPAALDNFLRVIRGRHFVSGWGKWYGVSERWLMGELTCPYCGSADIGGHVLVTWSAYYGRWVERSPPDIS